MAETVLFNPSPGLLGIAPQTVPKGLLRFATAGSVDDGKSTLIGRLLCDSRTVYEDQLDSIRKSRINRSSGPIDFSLLTDGLRAEREQGITIDVAYRYFSTPRRKFIIADTPGHEQYTRNMATGASNADAAIVLIDATKGLLTQSRRHTYIASLLGITHVIAAVNKMDLLSYDEAAFRRIERKFEELAGQLGLANVYVLPISALEGDNVVHSSERMPWFDGPPLLEYLEQLPSAQVQEHGPVRFPVQYVIRPSAKFRGFAGTVASGVLCPGMTLIALPSGAVARIRSMVGYAGERDEARAGESTTITLDREIDLSRGDLLVSEDRRPFVSRSLRAQLVWMYDARLDPGKHYLLKHTTRWVRARVSRVLHRVNFESLQHVPAEAIEMNDIVSAELETTLPLFFDLYRQNQTTGSFILVDPVSNATVAAGMIESALDRPTMRAGAVTSEERRRRFGHAPAAIWISGGEPLAEQLERELFDEGWHVQLVSSSHFSSPEFRTAATVLQRSGAIAILSAPDRDSSHRDAIRNLFDPHSFFVLDEDSRPNDEARSKLLAALRSWRDAQADRSEPL